MPLSQRWRSNTKRKAANFHFFSFKELKRTTGIANSSESNASRTLQAHLNNYWLIDDQCSPHIETSQVIWSANQLTGFYVVRTLALISLHTFCAACITRWSIHVSSVSGSCPGAVELSAFLALRKLKFHAQLLYCDPQIISVQCSLSIPFGNI